MAITAVGSTASASGTGLKTLAVSPTTIGDVLVLAVGSSSATVQISAVSGGGVTTWTRLIFANPTQPTQSDSELWFGPITATGARTITITTTAGSTIGLFARQFTIGTPATWTANGNGAAP